MAEETKVAAKAARAPSSADIERAREFAREPFLLEGEKPKDLATGTPPPGPRCRPGGDRGGARVAERRVAPRLLAMLGLERLLSEDEPHLADGAELSAHQVDAPGTPAP